MLCPKMYSINNESASLAYISQAMEYEEVELVFHNPRNLYRKHPFTSKVLTYLVKAVNGKRKKGKGKIVSLDLGCCDVSDLMLKELVNGQWHYLETLKLDRNKLSSLCIEYLHRGKWKTLKVLDLSHNNIKAINGRVFASCLPETLSELYLEDCQLDWRFLDDLQGNQWKELKVLELDRNSQLGNEGIQALVKCRWPKLQRLGLKACGLTDDSGKALRRGKWPHLHTLQLSQNQLSSAFLSVFSQNVCTNSLKELLMRSSRYEVREMFYDVEWCVSRSMKRELVRMATDQMRYTSIYPSRFDVEDCQIEQALKMRYDTAVV